MVRDVFQISQINYPLEKLIVTTVTCILRLLNIVSSDYVPYYARGEYNARQIKWVLANGQLFSIYLLLYIL